MSNFSDASPTDDADRKKPIAPEDETGFVPLSALPVTARERLASSKSQAERDRALHDSEEMEILPLHADQVDWQKAIDPPSKRHSPISSQTGNPAVPTPPACHPPVRSPVPPPASRSATVPAYPAISWRQSGRAQRWASLAPPNSLPLWVLQPLTVLILGWVIYTLIQTGQTLLNGLFSGLFWIPVLSAIRFAIDPTWIVIIGLIALFSASPWLLDGLLQQFYQLQPMSLSQLEHYSLESVRLLKRVSHQRRRPVPGLSVLPLAAPIAFSYGALPQLARIAVSQGLLEQLRDDEIAAIYAAELGHLDHWDVGVLSGLVLVAQLPYRVYWAAATWGNQQSNRALQSLAVLGSSIGYGCYWCCRLTGLWLSRVRLYYSDRRATNLTGNPNGLTRALLKVTIGIAAEIQRQGYTHPLLESFDLLIPVTPAAALTLGSLYPHMPTSALMTWDRSHPYRRWFASVSSHPLLGDRLYRLSCYGQRWHLEPELEWGQSVGQAAHSNRQTPAFRRLLLQIAPLVGALVGLAIGLVLGLLGWATYQARSYSFDWLWYGREAIVWGCVLLGFGIGLLIQINPAFGDLPRSSHQPESDLAELVSDFNLLPIDSTPVCFQGKLLGRYHLLNRCYQDLMLQTSFGLVRLHYTSRGGVLGNLCSQSQRPTDLMQPNETVSVTGWFRRGATPWIDVDTIQTKRGITVRSGYPIWLTIVAITSALWGIYTIFRG